jgi:hypothetical protein
MNSQLPTSEGMPQTTQPQGISESLIGCAPLSVSALLDKATGETLASSLYSCYCKAVGGVAFNGDPLPSWEDFAADETKAKQVGAWRVVAWTADKMLG